MLLSPPPLSSPNQIEARGASLPPVYRVSLSCRIPWCQTAGSAGPSPGRPRSRWPPRGPAGSSRRRGRRCCGRRHPGSSGWGICGTTGVKIRRHCCFTGGRLWRSSRQTTTRPGVVGSAVCLIWVTLVLMINGEHSSNLSSTPGTPPLYLFPYTFLSKDFIVCQLCKAPEYLEKSHINPIYIIG